MNKNPQKFVCVLMEGNSNEANQAIIQSLETYVSTSSIVLKGLPFFLLFYNFSHVRIGGFNEKWIGLYLENDFFNLFRMTQETSQKLWSKMQGPDVDHHTTYQGGGIPVPGVIGAIDGSNIRFKAPVNDQASYIDKNENHSIKMQAVCTHNKIFTNIVVGFPGSVHDPRIFRNSQLYMDVATNGQLRQYFPLEEYHLIGDKAYPLSNCIMKPYIGDERLLNQPQRNHNIAHSRTRIIVEHSFGLLKGRWRILKYINVNSIEKTVNIISACCILHNFCYLNGDNWADDNVVNVDDNLEGNDNGNAGVDNIMGIIKRDNISRIL